MKPISPPQVRQPKSGKSNFCQPQKQREIVKNDEISTQRSFVPITMCDFFPEDFFKHSIKTPCYEDCKKCLSKIV
ncbi:hypothetical protein ACFX12_034686 [Malus domestica]